MKKLINEIKYYDEMKIFYDRYKENILYLIKNNIHDNLSPFHCEKINLIINNKQKIKEVDIFTVGFKQYLYIKSNTKINNSILIDKNVYCIKYRLIELLTGNKCKVLTENVYR